jgi:HlyD family secretion protein
VAISKHRAVLGPIRTLFSVGTFRDLTDGQLLERFATDRAEAGEIAFAVLVERHGPMVLRVCRAVLSDSHEAQDAFQATFLILVRKTRGLWVRDSLGPWLHQVAHRTAKCARASAVRRRRFEARAISRKPSEIPDSSLGQILHEEIERLPERYRVPLILCDLEGRTHEQAARHLGWPIGTVKSRQSRARERLRERLTRRGHAPDSAMLLIALKDGAASLVPPSLADATTSAAAHYLTAYTILRASVSSLTQEVYRTMSITHGWKVASAVLALGLTVSGTALLTRGAPPRVEAAHKSSPADDARFVPVKSGKFQVTLVERGNVETVIANRVINQVEGLSTIVSIKPDGALVKAGELIGELDSATLKDNLTNQEIATMRAKAAHQTSEEAHEIAEAAVKEYTEWTSKLEKDTLAAAINTTRSAIEKAESRLERTRRALERLKTLLDRKEALALTSSDLVAELDLKDRLDDAEQTLIREKVALALATARREIFEKFTRVRTTRGLEATVKQAEADVFVRMSTWTLEKSKEDKLRRQIASCKLLAPNDGIVVYANDTPGRANRPNIEEGATVRERQILFSVLDVSGPMQINAKVRESMVDRIAPGQTVKITVDALPNQEFFGMVRRVQPLPDAGSYVNPDPKVYTTFVEIGKGSPALRPGMTAKVEILIAKVDDALTVPLRSVLRYDRKDHVAVKKPDGGFEWREVTLGKTDYKLLVEVKQGLKAGEMVAEDPASLMTEDERREKLPPPKRDPTRQPAAGARPGSPRDSG